MEITDIRIFLQPKANTKLKAYATLTFDSAFVVRNVKVIEGTKGLFVAMPSERAKEPCPKCGYRNAVRSRFCNQCGGPLNPASQAPSADASTGHKAEAGGGHEHGEEPSPEHRDIAHPITVECRQYIQEKVLKAYEELKGKAPEVSH